jgi:cell division protein FtsZ
MDEFNRHVSDTTRIHFGVATDPKLGKRLCVTIISSIGSAAPVATPSHRPAVARQPAPAIVEPAQRLPMAEPPVQVEEEPEPQLQPAAKAAPAPVQQSPQPAVQLVRKAPLERFTAPSKKEEKAEQMQLEPVNRGRFEKAEPTIVDGKDLDVPTFLRKNLSIK